MTRRKKLASSLREFSKLSGDDKRFLVAGLLANDVKEEVTALIEADSRIVFLGWKTPEDLNDLLFAADAYVQPGTQSATMQNALCCGCPVIIDDVRGHQPYLAAGAVLISDEVALGQAMKDALLWNPLEKRSQALSFAREQLDYKKLAQRVLQ